MSYLNFEKTSASDGNRLLPYAFLYGERSSVWSFAQMFRYADSFAIQNDTVFILRNSLCTSEKRVYAMPLCSKDKLHKAIELIVSDAQSYNAVPCLNNVTANVASVLNTDFSDIFEVTADRDYSEYIYRTEDLITLSGRKYQAKRTRIKNFLKICGTDCSVLIFGQGNSAADNVADKIIINNISEFQGKWLATMKDLPTYNDLEKEDLQIRYMLDNYCALGLSGFEVKVNNATAGYAFGNLCSTDCFDLIAEKADTSFKGIYQFINNQVAKTIAKQFTYINMEDDVGLVGLRESKLSYNPCFILEKFNAIYKQPTVLCN